MRGLPGDSESRIDKGGRVENWRSSDVLSPVPSHQTVRSVFPNTAFQSSSSRGFRLLSPWGGCRYLIEAEVFIQVSVRKCFISPILHPMFASQICSHPFIKVSLQLQQVSTAIAIVKIVHPTSDNLVEFIDDHFF